VTRAVVAIPLAARAARSVSDAAAGIASVLIAAEVERAEAERLVGAHDRERSELVALEHPDIELTV
jgi:hypothetical protein